MAIDEVREALYELLKEDDTLKKVAVGGVHFQIAPAGTADPYIIFQKPSGVPMDAFAGPSLDKEVWLVKGVSTKTRLAEEINKRCLALLNGATLTITGKENQDLRRIADVNYGEQDKGEIYRHVGAEYKLDSEEEE